MEIHGLSKFLGQFQSHSQLPTIDQVSVFPSDSAYTLDDGGYWIATQPSAPPGAVPQWLFIDTLRGSPGPQGEAGVGTAGPQGQLGPTGQPGRPGPQGPAGKNSFSYLSQTFTVPAMGVTVPTPVSDSSWMAPGLLVYIPGAGTFTCVGSPPDAHTVNLANSGDPNNLPPGTVVSGGTTISPAAQRGPSGPQGSTGPQGPAGPQGVSGASAYTTLRQDFTVPTTSGVAFVVSAVSFAPGLIVYCGSGNYFSVSAVDIVANTLTLVNQNYPGGQSPGTLITAGNTVSGTGPQGPQGIQGPVGPQGPQGLLGVAPTGSVIMWTTSTPPAGWLLCNGASYPQTQYPDLYAVIGISYGGVLGSGPFSVPDMRDMFPVGASPTKPLTGVGSVGGSATVTLATGNLPSHNHTANAPDHYHTNADYNYGNHAHSATMPDHRHVIPAGAFTHNHTDSGHTHGYQTTNIPGPQIQSGGGDWAVRPVQTQTAAAAAVISTYNSPVTGTYYSSQYDGLPGFNTAACGNILVRTDYMTSTGFGTACSVGNTGSGTAFSIMPPYRCFNFIIKT